MAHTGRPARSGRGLGELVQLIISYEAISSRGTRSLVKRLRWRGQAASRLRCALALASLVLRCSSVASTNTRPRCYARASPSARQSSAPVFARLAGLRSLVWLGRVESERGAADTAIPLFKDALAQMRAYAYGWLPPRVLSRLDGRRAMLARESRHTRRACLVLPRPSCEGRASAFNAVMQLSPRDGASARAGSTWTRCIHTRVERGVTRWMWRASLRMRSTNPSDCARLHRSRRPARRLDSAAAPARGRHGHTADRSRLRMASASAADVEAAALCRSARRPDAAVRRLVDGGCDRRARGRTGSLPASACCLPIATPASSTRHVARPVASDTRPDCSTP